MITLAFRDSKERITCNQEVKPHFGKVQLGVSSIFLKRCIVKGALLEKNKPHGIGNRTPDALFASFNNIRSWQVLVVPEWAVTSISPATNRLKPESVITQPRKKDGLHPQTHLSTIVFRMPSKHIFCIF